MTKPSFIVADELPAGRDVRPERVDWEAAKQALIDNPGKWVLMAEDVSSSMSGQLSTGKNKNFRGDELVHFEFAVRKPDGATYSKRRSDLWGKFHA